MEEVFVGTSVSLFVFSCILVVIVAVRLRRRYREMPEFKTIRSEGTDARTFMFTGRYVAKATHVHPSYGVRTYRLYETPSGMYRIIYPNGNVSFRKDKDEVCRSEPKLARNAGLSRVVHLDVFEEKKGV